MAAAILASAAATLAKAASDREVARERLLLRNRQARLKLRQQYLAGTITDRSTIPEHGGDDQPMQNARHDYVEYGWGAEDQKKVGTHARGENKIKSKNTQDQSSTAGRLGRGLIFPQDLGGPFPIKIDAQRTPEVALQKGDFRYNLREEKQKRRIAGGGH